MAAERQRDRLERLTNLMLVLIDTTRPLTLSEITDEVEGYPHEHEVARQAFERDKRMLREIGVPVRTVAVEGADQAGYLIDPKEYYLADLGLDEEESRALAFAVAAVELEGSPGRDALSSLGHALAGGREVPVAVLPSVPALGPVHEALRKRALLSFDYRGRSREVEPYGLTFRSAAWYLVGKDRSIGQGGAMRTFRVDRFESEATLGEEGAFSPPDELDLREEVNLLPFETDEAEGPLAEVRVDARLARQVAEVLPRDAPASFASDGSVTVKLPVGDVKAFYSWAAGLGDTATVLSPPELSSGLVSYLGELAGAGRKDSPAPGRQRRKPPPKRPSRPPVTVPAAERLRRLLAVLVYLARVGEASISETAERFSMSPGELVHDLELAACCGVPPYTPDQLIELLVEGDRVYALGLGHLSRPRRLNAEQGFALAAAARALADVEGAGEKTPLSSAISKLEAALGESRFSLDLAEPELLAEVRAARKQSRRIEISYFSSAASEPTLRQVDPYQVVLREGRWYLDGYCHLAGGARRFQVDRIQSVKETGESFEPPEALDESLSSGSAFLGGPDAVRVRLVFPSSSALGVEKVALGPPEPYDVGRLETEVLVADAEGWFGRLCLSLGPGTEVLSPPELVEIPARSAERALSNYKR